MNVLIVDDQGDTIYILIDHINGISDWTHKLVPSARLALSELDHHWDVVFIDLKLSQNNTTAPGAAYYEGIYVGETARRKSAASVIIMYSEDVSSENPSSFGFHNECLAAGADLVMARSKLVHLGVDALKAQINTLVETRRALQRTRRPLHVNDGLMTRAAVQAVSAHVISAMLEQLLAGMDEDSIELLTGGFTGAYVFSVRSKSSRAGYVYNVIKISTSTGSLQDELARRPPPGSVFNLNAVRPEGSRAASVGRWHGILIPAVRDALLLRDYLSRSFNQKAKRTLEAVVTHLLVFPASQVVDATPDEIPYSLHLGTAAEICEVLKQLKSWTSLIKKRDQKMIEYIESVVLNIAQGKYSFSKFKRLALLHGDFHCRNVFISESAPPLLIDFGRSEVYPRMFDFAALDADLLFSVLDYGTGRDHLLGANVAKWVKRATAQYPFRDKVVSRENSTCWACLRHILLTHAVSSIDKPNQTEYAEALAFHALRYLRFPSTTASKKLMAVQLLSLLLKQLGF